MNQEKKMQSAKTNQIVTVMNYLENEYLFHVLKQRGFQRELLTCSWPVMVAVDGPEPLSSDWPSEKEEPWHLYWPWENRQSLTNIHSFKKNNSTLINVPSEEMLVSWLKMIQYFEYLMPMLIFKCQILTYIISKYFKSFRYWESSHIQIREL